jgi:hypothetical protein
MGKIITITDLTGTEPYQISLCASDFTGCFFYATINDSDIPFDINVPFIINNYTSYGVLAVDANGCEIKQTITI